MMSLAVIIVMIPRHTKYRHSRTPAGTTVLRHNGQTAWDDNTLVLRVHTEILPICCQVFGDPIRFRRSSASTFAFSELNIPAWCGHNYHTHCTAGECDPKYYTISWCNSLPGVEIYVQTANSKACTNNFLAIGSSNPFQISTLRYAADVTEGV